MKDKILDILAIGTVWTVKIFNWTALTLIIGTCIYFVLNYFAFILL